MTYSTLTQEIPSQQFTCSTCPNFENFNGKRGRGLCKYHDQVVFEYHQSRNECISALERESDKHLQSYEQPEDIPYSEFAPGQKVKVIDEGDFIREATGYEEIGNDGYGNAVNNAEASALRRCRCSITTWFAILA